MTVTREQAQMLTALAIACRPHRAPTWDEAGIMAQLAKLRDWQLSEVALRVIVCAADREAKTPAVIAAPGTRIPEVKTGPFQPNTWNPHDFCECGQPMNGHHSTDHEPITRPQLAARTAAASIDVARAVAGLRDVKATETPPEHVKPTPSTTSTEDMEALRKALTPPHPVVGDQVEDQAAVAAEEAVK